MGNADPSIYPSCRQEVPLRLIVAFIALAPVAGYAQDIAAPPNFEFRGIRAGEGGVPSSYGRCPAMQEFVNTRICIELGGPKVAGVPLASHTVISSQGRLATMIGRYRSDEFNQIRAAFTEKYGAHCEETSEPWQSRMGAQLTSTVVTWCFSTGKLRMRSLDRRIGEGSFMYIDNWHPVAATPRVDF